LALRLRLARGARLTALVDVDAFLPQSQRLGIDAELARDVLDRGVIGLVIGASLAQHSQRALTELVRIRSWHNSILQKERTERNSGRINPVFRVLAEADSLTLPGDLLSRSRCRLRPAGTQQNPTRCACPIRGP